MKKIISVVALVVLLFGGIALYVHTHQPVQNTDQNQDIGAAPGPDSSSPYYTINNLQTFKTRKGLTQATTTVCAIQSPTATSSLSYASVTLRTSSTTASTVTLAKATTPYATTTSLGSAPIAANAQGSILATTTPTSALDPSQVFAPNTWFVVGMQGGTGTFSPVGSCSAVFNVL